MLCKILEQDESWYLPNKEGWSKMPLFGRGQQTWYKLVDHGLTWKEDGQFSRYGIRKSFIGNDDNERYYASAPIQDKEAMHLINGNVLTVDGDSIELDKRTKIFRNMSQEILM